MYATSRYEELELYVSFYGFKLGEKRWKGNQLEKLEAAKAA